MLTCTERTFRERVHICLICYELLSNSKSRAVQRNVASFDPKLASAKKILIFA